VSVPMEYLPIVPDPTSSFLVAEQSTKFGSRAFSIAGPQVWNRLPQSVRSADTVRQFIRLLKTHYTTFLSYLTVLLQF